MLVIVVVPGHAITEQPRLTSDLLNRKEEDICGDTVRLSIKYAERSKVVS